MDQDLTDQAGGSTRRTSYLRPAQRAGVENGTRLLTGYRGCGLGQDQDSGEVFGRVMALRYEELDMESRARLDRFLTWQPEQSPNEKAEGSKLGRSRKSKFLSADIWRPRADSGAQIPPVLLKYV